MLMQQRARAEFLDGISVVHVARPPVDHIRRVHEFVGDAATWLAFGTRIEE